MKRHLRFKFIFILVVILACIYGIIGLPRSKDQLIENWHKNIRLGLDLRGGTYLVVQVQQQDAFNAEAGTAAERLKDVANKAGVQYSDIEVAEAKSLQDATKVAILVKGVPSTQAGTFRGLVSEQFGQWLLTPQNATDYRLTMKPSEALKLWQQVLAQTKNTIDKKINALGLSEATVQQRREDADSQLLIQMPGVDDPGRVKQILQTAAVLELYDVRGGPYASREEALAQNNGVLPAGHEIDRYQQYGSKCPKRRSLPGERERLLCGVRIFGTPGLSRAICRTVGTPDSCSAKMLRSALLHTRAAMLDSVSQLF